MRSSAGTNQAIMNIPPSRLAFTSFSPAPQLFLHVNHMPQINEARRYTEPSPLRRCSTQYLASNLFSFTLFLLLFIFIPLSLSGCSFCFFAHVSQLRNCLHPTQSGAGLKFPIGYVPICREHTSTDAIREQAYELPGSLPSLSSDRMALIPDYDPNNNTTTTWKPKQLGAGKGFIIYILMDLLTKTWIPPQKLKCHGGCQQSRDFGKKKKKKGEEGRGVGRNQMPSANHVPIN